MRKNEHINNLYAAKEMLINCQDDYNTGMYNGIEYALSVLENRKPEYLVLVGEREAEQKEKKTRTVITGIRRKT